MKFSFDLRKGLPSFLLMLSSVGISGNLTGQEVAVVDPNIHNTGVRTPTDKQLESLKSKPRIIGVNPNKIGRARMAAHAESLGAVFAPIPTTSDAEFITDQDGVDPALLASSATALPASVDNSSLPCFPPISSQGAEGSCVGFATTYYHATHEIGLLNGYNNKTSSANVLSPKWTYNMINGGGDSGSWPPIAYTLLAQNGATSIANFPYVVGDLLSWDLNTQDWIGAMSNRMGPSYTVNIGGDSSDFSAIKQLLNNGHVVTVCTYAYSWQITKILQAPNGAADNRFVGQSAISWMNGSSGGHNVTIVGYNDDIWIDVNGNGQIDPGEKGAFLVANQWGSNWGNNGFIWVSYDAFLKKSAVPNGPSTGRVAFASLMSNLAVAAVPKSAHYKPQLVAKFGLTAAIRSQIEISAGVSSTTSTTPAKTLQSGALNHQGGAFGFDGKNQKESATFALDLTDLVDTTPSNTNNRFYLIVNDNASGNPTQIDSFSLIDYAHNQTTNGVNFPQVVDANTLNVFVDNNVTPPPQPPSPSPSPSPSPTLLPIVFITSPLDHSTVSCSLPVSVSVTGNSLPISMVALYLDHFQILVDQEAPYTFLLDTTKLTNGYHQLLAVAVDTDGNVGKANVAINVKNGCP